MLEILIILITVLTGMILSYLAYYLRKAMLSRLYAKPMKIEVKSNVGDKYMIEIRDDMNEDETNRIINLLGKFARQTHGITSPHLESISSESVQNNVEAATYYQPTHRKTGQKSNRTSHIREEQRFPNLAEILSGILIGLASIFISYYITANYGSSLIALVSGQLIIFIILVYISMVLVGLFSKNRKSSEIKGKTQGEEEHYLWLASRRFMNGEFTGDELEVIEDNSIKEFKQSLIKHAQLSYKSPIL